MFLIRALIPGVGLQHLVLVSVSTALSSPVLRSDSKIPPGIPPAALPAAWMPAPTLRQWCQRLYEFFEAVGTGASLAQGMRAAPRGRAAARPFPPRQD